MLSTNSSITELSLDSTIQSEHAALLVAGLRQRSILTRFALRNTELSAVGSQAVLSTIC